MKKTMDKSKAKDKKNPKKKWGALWVRADEHVQGVLERLLVKLYRERGKMPSKADVLSEAILEKAKKHGVR